MFFRFLLLTAVISVATCVIQEITLYSETGLGGDSHTFKSKHASLNGLEQAFLQSAKSWCATGWWRGYSSVNYGGSNPFGAGFYPTRTCHNTTLSAVKSLRYLGPLNTSTVSITLYNGTASDSWSGKEVIITEQAASDFEFSPHSAILMGPSNWTIFPNPDFTGSAVCLLGEFEVRLYVFPEGAVKSLVRGCHPSTLP